MTDRVDRERALRLEIAPLTFEMERGRLRFFAETIGLTDPIYLDREAAKRAGHRDVVVPPTFLSNSLELEIANPLSWLVDLGVELDKTTHAEQSFAYNALAYAGDVLTFHRRVVDVYSKKEGALEFVVKQTDVVRSDGVPILQARCTIGIIHGPRK